MNGLALKLTFKSQIECVLYTGIFYKSRAITPFKNVHPFFETFSAISHDWCVARSYLFLFLFFYEWTELCLERILDTQNINFGCVESLLEPSEVNFPFRKRSFWRNSEPPKNLGFCFFQVFYVFCDIMPLMYHMIIIFYECKKESSEHVWDTWNIHFGNVEIFVASHDENFSLKKSKFWRNSEIQKTLIFSFFIEKFSSGDATRISTHPKWMFQVFQTCSEHGSLHSWKKKYHHTMHQSQDIAENVKNLEKSKKKGFLRSQNFVKNSTFWREGWLHMVLKHFLHIQS